MYVYVCMCMRVYVLLERKIFCLRYLKMAINSTIEKAMVMEARDSTNVVISSANKKITVMVYVYIYIIMTLLEF